MENPIQKATETVRLAIEQDKQGKYAEAFDSYRRALEQFTVAMKWEKNPATANAVRIRVLSYVTRAEEIERELSNAASRSSSSTVGSNNNNNNSNTALTSKSSEFVDAEHLKSAIRDTIVQESPHVKFTDVVGLEEAKVTLREAVVYPRKFPQIFTGLRRPWSGILLYGPPGTGKSFLAKAVATEIDAVFFSVSSSDLVSKWQGESERLVKHLFQLAQTQERDSIVFIDEIDSLCGSRTDGEDDSTRRIKTEFLVQMDGVHSSSTSSERPKTRVLVLAATNTPWSLDVGIRRRFEKRIYIALPNLLARERMFRKFMESTPHSLTDDDFGRLAKRTEGYSGADIETMGRAAAFEPLRAMERVTHFRLVNVKNEEEGEEEEKAEYDPIFEFRPCGEKDLDGAKCGETTGERCERCGAIRMDLMSVPNGRLRVIPVTIANLECALLKTPSTVANSELMRFEKWTATFGSEG